jgi:ribonuclease HI
MSELPVAVVHADESCLGNGQDGRTPGGAAALIELRWRGRIVRRDLYLSSPDTTNNRMALSGAIATFSLLGAKGKRLRVIFVSDSEYLIKGMREWVPTWQHQGWKRKGGPVENLDLWKTLTQVASQHDPVWVWVRGHAGDPKNEYANDLAMRAAEHQLSSGGAVPSGFLDWLAEKRRYGRFLGYDPDKAFEQLAATEASIP